MRHIFYLGGLIFVLSCLVFFFNSSVTLYHGNNYLPPNTLGIGLILFFINIGLSLCFTKQSYPCKAGRELLHFFAVMVLIAIASNAAQFTPFPLIDEPIMTLEAAVHINMLSIIEWTANHPHFKKLLVTIYDSLPYQMSMIPLFIIAIGRFNIIREYYFLMLFTTLLGFTIYYFFPTNGPADIIQSPLFSFEQRAAGIKFNQIHQHLLPTTNQGGLIAFPSFHVVWALLSIYLLKEWLIPCLLITVINSLLIASCILLGWHYVIDVVGGILLVLFSLAVLNRLQDKKSIHHIIM